MNANTIGNVVAMDDHADALRFPSGEAAVSFASAVFGYDWPNVAAVEPRWFPEDMPAHPFVDHRNERRMTWVISIEDGFVGIRTPDDQTH